MRLTTKINALDITRHVQRYGMGFAYEKREGGNGGMMLDGSMTVDVLAWKTVLTVPLNPLTASEQAAILAEAMNQYVSVFYFEPKMNAYRTAAFIPSIGQISTAILNENGSHWFEGLALTLIER